MLEGTRLTLDLSKCGFLLATLGVGALGSTAVMMLIVVPSAYARTLDLIQDMLRWKLFAAPAGDCKLQDKQVGRPLLHNFNAGWVTPLASVQNGGLEHERS